MLVLEKQTIPNYNTEGKRNTQHHNSKVTRMISLFKSSRSDIQLNLTDAVICIKIRRCIMMSTWLPKVDIIFPEVCSLFCDMCSNSLKTQSEMLA